MATLNFVALLVWLAGIIVLLIVQPVIALLWAVGYSAFWMIVVSAVDGIYRVALYRYACFKDKTPLFDPQLVDQAFARKY